jgi:DHA1 family tetracycline resistance protein-like MFS transporter
LAPDGLVFLLGIPIMALWGFASSTALGLMSRRVGASEQGRLQGANSSIMGIANMLGPALFTQTFAFAIGLGDGGHLPGAPFLLAALLLAVALLVAWRVTRSP